MLSIYIISLIGSVAFPYLVGAQCTSVCQGFATGLDNCKNLYDAAVEGTGPVSDQGVTCACGPLSLGNLQDCYNCGQPATLVALWMYTCATYNQDGVQAGIACFDTLEQNLDDTSQCVALNDVSSPSSSASSSAVPTVASVGGGGNVATTTTIPVAGATQPVQPVSTPASSSSQKANGGYPCRNAGKNGWEASLAFSVVVIAYVIF